MRQAKKNLIAGSILDKFSKAKWTRRPENGNVVIVGPFSSVNGLSRAARFELTRLAETFPDATVIDISNDKLRFAKYAEQAERPADVVVFLAQPYLVPSLLNGVKPEFLNKAWRICMGVLELPYAPSHWMPMRDFFHEIWTPSEFSASGMRQFMNAEVKVVPHYVTAGGISKFPRAEQSRAHQLEFNGLAIMDLGVCPDRKNPWAHIEAWQKAFGGNESAQLTLKLRFSRRTKVVRGELEEMIGDDRNIKILDDDLSDLKILEVQEKADVGLSLHRTEGYGLTIQELLELGKPVVATAWSGNMTFMPLYENAMPVPYNLVAYRDYLYRYRGYKGCWAEADTDVAARILRAVAKKTLDPNFKNESDYRSYSTATGALDARQSEL